MRFSRLLAVTLPPLSNLSASNTLGSYGTDFAIGGALGHAVFPVETDDNRVGAATFRYDARTAVVTVSDIGAIVSGRQVMGSGLEQEECGNKLTGEEHCGLAMTKMRWMTLV